MRGNHKFAVAFSYRVHGHAISVAEKKGSILVFFRCSNLYIYLGYRLIICVSIYRKSTYDKMSPCHKKAKSNTEKSCDRYVSGTCSKKCLTYLVERTTRQNLRVKNRLYDPQTFPLFRTAKLRSGALRKSLLVKYNFVSPVGIVRSYTDACTWASTQSPFRRPGGITSNKYVS